MLRNKIGLLVLAILFNIIQVEACRYTIREIGFSALNKVTYILYRVDSYTATFPNQLAAGFKSSNIKTHAINASIEKDNQVIAFAKSQNKGFPVYVLVDINKRMLALSAAEYKNKIVSGVLASPIQQQLQEKLPVNYATVLLIEGREAESNHLARQHILKTCKHIENIMPNMPKQVDLGPDMTVIEQSNFEDEKVLLWSLGVDEVPKKPIAFILYAKGRIMGEQVDFEDIISEKLYGLMSIIGADCECGLDRKWMLGYQVPLDWPKDIRQGLSDRLGFDVDNPMVLTEMSRILAIENRAPKTPDGISFEPIVVDLDKEFNDIPEIEHKVLTIVDGGTGNTSNQIIWYSMLGLLLIISVGSFFILKKKS
ncbi:hypothetical protein [Aestuariivivens marinum]|uniref:hypothetical protein n=1 Tax=Aestuariivivens marinum TaxID=2913555 RepID=UPI001F57BA1D|nr:hypothetical protein [Aestuariivivens marinum]